MKRTSCLALVVAAALAIPAAAAAEGTDPTARAAFAGPIQVNGAKATLKVRYRCSSGQNLWVSAKETTHGYSATKLMKEGSSRAAAAWWDSHRNRVVCDGKFHATTFTIDKVEKGKGHPRRRQRVGPVLRDERPYRGGHRAHALEERLGQGRRLRR